MDATAYWRQRAKSYGEEFPERPPWVEHYWASWRMPHRLELLKAIAAIDDPPPPPYSLFEVGCNVGPNLRLWRERWPDRMLLGCDVSPEAVTAAQRYFADDPRTYFWRDDVATSAWLPMADVLVSCYTLAYVSPMRLPDVLATLWRSARRAVVLAEPMTVTEPAVLAEPPAVVEGEEAVIEETPTTYRHNYARHLTALGARVSIVEIPETDQLNAILTARRP